MGNNIGVLIPIHNGEDTLDRSLNSVLSQEVNGIDNIYVICILNCCNNPNILMEKILDKNYENYNSIFDIRVIECSEKGIVPALNSGIQYLFQFEHSLITRQDVDDVWLPGKLKKQVEFMNQYKKIDILGSAIRLVKPTGEFIQDFHYPENDKEIRDWMYSGQNPIAHPSVMFRSKVLLRTGGYSDLYPVAEDYDLWLRASRWHKFANLNDVLVQYNSTHNPNYNPFSPQLASRNMNAVIQHFGINIK